MKASQLILKLQKALLETGDLDVHVGWDGEKYPINSPVFNVDVLPAGEKEYPGKHGGTTYFGWPKVIRLCAPNNN